LKKFIVLAWLLLSAACTKPAADTRQPGAATNNQRPPIASTSVVKATPEELTLAKGSSGEAIVHVQIQNGYHINANPASFSYLIATNLDITPAGGVSVEFITYPDPQTRTFSFADTPLKVYEGDTLVKAKLKAAPAAEPGKHNLSAKLRVQACDDQVCYAPGTIDLTIPVAIK
jgi:DsbC/DsbD-like thiol-disulfide interchange protein